MAPSVERIEDVVARHLCAGCGACAAVAPDAIAMLDVADQGTRPSVAAGADTRAALAACPGAALERVARPAGALDGLWDEWGPVLALHTARAADPVVRDAAGGPGVVTALAIAALERVGFTGVLHARAGKPPFLSETVLSTTRAELLAAAGPRLVPASPAEGLPLLAERDGPFLFVGKPCDVAGAQKAAAVQPALGENVGATVALFCLGAPASRASLELVRALGFESPSNVDAIRYRAGDGTRLEVSATVKHGRRVESIGLAEAWARHLAPARPWRCHTCPDHTGEFADLAVGGAPDGRGERALVLVRTERGRAFLERVAGSLELEPLDAVAGEGAGLPGVHADLLAARAAAQGAIVASRLAGLAVPRYAGFDLEGAWRARFGLGRRLRAVLGMAREVLRRGLRRPARVHVKTGRLRGIQRFGTDA